MLRSFAPAKINLYLHITGKRADGFHLLDSLVAFTNIGDEVRIEPAEAFSFAVEGPAAEALRHEPAENNLVVRAAQALAAAAQQSLNVAITLYKNLPVASGIGGGSSDAAAVLRLLAQYWDVEDEEFLLPRIARGLGQDVPCCLDAITCYFSDTGATLDAGPDLPHTDIVLVNPNKPLPTPSVYKARQGGFADGGRFERDPADAAELAAMLRSRSNGLTDAACLLLPDIHDVLKALEASEGCLLARMSGSGATCFGLYGDRSAARQAAARIFEAHPGWWVVPGFVPYRARGR